MIIIKATDIGAFLQHSRQLRSRNRYYVRRAFTCHTLLRPERIEGERDTSSEEERQVKCPVLKRKIIDDYHIN